MANTIDEMMGFSARFPSSEDNNAVVGGNSVVKAFHKWGRGVMLSPKDLFSCLSQHVRDSEVELPRIISLQDAPQEGSHGFRWKLVTLIPPSEVMGWRPQAGLERLKFDEVVVNSLLGFSPN